MTAPRRCRALAHATTTRSVLGILAGLTTVLLLSGCATTWPTFSGVTSASPDETYSCALARAQALGYKRGTWNADDHDMTVRREDPEATKLLPGEQRRFDILVARATAGPGGNGAALRVRAQTVTRRFTRAGWVEEDAPASAGAKLAAQAILKECST